MKTSDPSVPVLPPSPITSLDLVYQGKVRDIHKINDDHWLIIASDRASAYDVILPTPITGKGILLTQLALFWFKHFEEVANHLADLRLEDVLSDARELDYARGRSMIVKRLDPLPVEAVVRGYISGSGWKDYQASGSVCGHTLPDTLQHADRLATPLFTPATKAALGDHDENITRERMQELLGKDLATEIEQLSIRIYEAAARHAQARGLLLADTKFEFGLDSEGRLTLMDEILTPDSSRFWEAATWQPGTVPPSYDKQFLRDWLKTQDWDGNAPGPELPHEIVEGTLERYRSAVTRLSE